MSSSSPLTEARRARAFATGSSACAQNSAVRIGSGKSTTTASKETGTSTTPITKVLPAIKDQPTTKFSDQLGVVTPAVQHPSTATPSTGNDLDRPPRTNDLPQRPQRPCRQDRGRVGAEREPKAILGAHRAGLPLSLSGTGSGFEPGEYEVVQGVRPGFPVGCGVDLPQAGQGEDDVVWIKSGADDARLLGGG